MYARPSGLKAGGRERLGPTRPKFCAEATASKSASASTTRPIIVSAGEVEDSAGADGAKKGRRAERLRTHSRSSRRATEAREGALEPAPLYDTILQPRA